MAPAPAGGVDFGAASRQVRRIMTSPAAPLAPRLLVLIAISSVSPLAINIVVPAMPGLQRVFATDYATVQLSLSLYLAAFALGQMVMGPLSDRFGRRPVVLAGLGLFIAGSVMCVAAPGVEVLLAGRVVQAIGGAAGMSLARAIVRDLHEKDQAAAMIGYMTTGMAMAQTVSPTVGGLIYERVGWSGIFWMLILAGAATYAMAFATLGETNRHRGGRFDVRHLIRGWATLLSLPGFVLPTVTAACASAVYFAFMGGAPFIVTELMGLSPSVYGLYFVMVAGGYAIGNFASGRQAARFGTARMINAGNALALAATGLMLGGLMLGLAHPLMLFLPMLLVSIANGITLPSAVAEAVSARPELAGAASGLNGACQVGLGALASAWAGAHAASGAWPLAWIMAGFAAASLVFGMVSARMLRPAV